MGHRHNINSSNLFGVAQNQNQNFSSAEQSYAPIGGVAASRGGSFFCPGDGLLRDEVPPSFQRNFGTRAEGHIYSRSSMQVQYFPLPVAGSPYVPSHSSASRNIHIPERNAVHFRHFHSHTANPFDGLSHYLPGNRSGPFKRKSYLGFSGVSERGSTSRSYDSGNSSNASEMLNPMSDYENIYSNHTSFHHHRSTNIPVTAEDSWRNVRSRYRYDLGPNTLGAYIPNYSTHRDRSTSRPAYHPTVADPTHLNSGATTEEWSGGPLSAVASGRYPNSDYSGSSYMTNQPSFRSDASEIRGHHNSLPRQNPIPYLHNVHGSMQNAGVANFISYTRMTPSYVTDLDHSELAYLAAPSDSNWHSPAENLTSRYTSSVSVEGQHNVSRPGICFDRFHSHPSVLDAPYPLGSESLMMVDQSRVHSSYHGGSRSLFDEYSDMLIDVDNMSYEELLTLEERIGSVNTGLSDHMISRCLVTVVYPPSVQNLDEGTCAICLEGYKAGEEIGSIKSCGHDYHVSCIRKWLSMKNVCPICKASALAEEKL